MMPTDEFVSATSFARSDAEADGFGWSLHYRWTHPDHALAATLPPHMARTLRIDGPVPDGIEGARPGPYVVMDARWQRITPPA